MEQAVTLARQTKPWIGGIFETYKDAREVCFELILSGVREKDIQMVMTYRHREEASDWARLLLEMGMAEEKVRFYEQAIRDGKVLLIVREVNSLTPLLPLFLKATESGTS
jgi:hypothetical protein